MENKAKIDDINIIEMFKVIYENKILIFLITSTFAISSVIYALSLPNIYHSSALVFPSESQDSAMSEMSQRYGGIAAIAGISIPSSGTVNKVNLAINKLYSRQFLGKLLEKKDIKEKIYATKAFDSNKMQIIYDPQLYDSLSNKWVREVQPPFTSAPSTLEVHELYLSEVISVSHDRLTNFITITIRHKSPLFAKELLELIISEINEQTRVDSINESNKALEYLQSEYIATSDIGMRDSISRLIESQMKIQMLANAQDGFLLNVVDGAYTPEKKSSPSRSTICIIGTLLGFILSIIIVFVRRLQQS